MWQLFTDVLLWSKSQESSCHPCHQGPYGRMCFFFFTVLSLLRNYIILSKLPRRSLGSQIFSGELQNNVISYYWVKLISFVNFIFKKYDFLLSVNKYTLFLLNKHRNMRRNEVQRPKPRNCQWAGFPPITH